MEHLTPKTKIWKPQELAAVAAKVLRQGIERWRWGNRLRLSELDEEAALLEVKMVEAYLLKLSSFSINDRGDPPSPVFFFPPLNPPSHSMPQDLIPIQKWHWRFFHHLMLVGFNLSREIDWIDNLTPDNNRAMGTSGLHEKLGDYTLGMWLEAQAKRSMSRIEKNIPETPKGFCDLCWRPNKYSLDGKKLGLRLRCATCSESRRHMVSRIDKWLKESKNEPDDIRRVIMERQVSIRREMRANLDAKIPLAELQQMIPYTPRLAKWIKKKKQEDPISNIEELLNALEVKKGYSHGWDLIPPNLLMALTQPPFLPLYITYANIIARAEAWMQLEDEYQSARPRGRPSTFDMDKVANAKKMMDDGLSLREAARRVGMPHTTLSRLVKAI